MRDYMWHVRASLIKTSSSFHFLDTIPTQTLLYNIYSINIMDRHTMLANRPLVLLPARPSDFPIPHCPEWKKFNPVSLTLELKVKSKKAQSERSIYNKWINLNDRMDRGDSERDLPFLWPVSGTSFGRLVRVLAKNFHKHTLRTLHSMLGCV